MASEVRRSEEVSNGGASSSHPELPDSPNIYLGNLSTGMTITDIKTFLKIDHCVLQLREGTKSHHCFVTVPSQMVDEVLKLNGQTINGRGIRVEPVVGGENGSKTPNQTLIPAEPEAPTKNQATSQHSQNPRIDQDGNYQGGLTNELYVRFLGYMKPWDVPSYGEVAQSALRYFQQE